MHLSQSKISLVNYSKHRNKPFKRAFSKMVWHNPLYLQVPGCLGIQGWTSQAVTWYSWALGHPAVWHQFPRDQGLRLPAEELQVIWLEDSWGACQQPLQEGTLTFLNSHCIFSSHGRWWGQLSPFLYKLRHPFWEITTWFQAYILNSSPYSLEELCSPGRGQDSWDPADDNIL